MATIYVFLISKFALYKSLIKMNIVITGSLGHISKPLTKTLVQKGYKVTVISSKEERVEEIAALGAIPAIGSLTDTDFLAQTFTGADVVYLMEPPFNFTDPDNDIIQAWVNIAHSYKTAVEQSGIIKVVHLSSIGAHTDKGNGMLAAHYYVEQILAGLPAAVVIKTLRPVGFYYNMFAYTHSIRAVGKIFQNYGGDIKEPWVSPIDIATAIAEQITLPFNERSVRYVASEELTGNEVAKILGDAIGVNVEWLELSDAVFEENLLKAGFSAQAAKGLTEMNAGRRAGLYDDYNKHRPELGTVKLADFARDFAAVFNQ